MRKHKWLVPLPPIIANMLIVPWVLQTAYGFTDAYWYLMLTVGAGEVISCYIFGMILLFALDKHKKQSSVNRKFGTVVRHTCPGNDSGYISLLKSRFHTRNMSCMKPGFCCIFNDYISSSLKGITAGMSLICSPIFFPYRPYHTSG